MGRAPLEVHGPRLTWGPWVLAPLGHMGPFGPGSRPGPFAQALAYLVQTLCIPCLPIELKTQTLCIHWTIPFLTSIGHEKKLKYIGSLCIYKHVYSMDKTG